MAGFLFLIVVLEVVLVDSETLPTPRVPGELARFVKEKQLYVVFGEPELSCMNAVRASHCLPGSVRNEKCSLKTVQGQIYRHVGIYRTFL